MNQLNSAKFWLFSRICRIQEKYLAEIFQKIAEFKSAKLAELAEFKTTIYILEEIIYVTVDNLRNLRRPYFILVENMNSKNKTRNACMRLDISEC